MIDDIGSKVLVGLEQTLLLIKPNFGTSQLDNLI